MIREPSFSRARRAARWFFGLSLPLLAATVAAAEEAAAPAPVANPGDTAWVLAASGLVLMMTLPGLALFYGGLVRRKNILGTMMQSFAMMGLITILWPIVGYTLAFGHGSNTLHCLANADAVNHGMHGGGALDHHGDHRKSPGTHAPGCCGLYCMSALPLTPVPMVEGHVIRPTLSMPAEIAFTSRGPGRVDRPPIVFPSVAAFCLTPICPHTLTNRPVIVPESSVIRLECLAEDGAAFLTIDGQVGEPLLKGDQIVCRSSVYAIHLIRPPRMLFFDVLRAKLKWGER